MATERTLQELEGLVQELNSSATGTFDKTMAELQQRIATRDNGLQWGFVLAGLAVVGFAVFLITQGMHIVFAVSSAGAMGVFFLFMLGLAALLECGVDLEKAELQELLAPISSSDDREWLKWLVAQGRAAGREYIQARGRALAVVDLELAQALAQKAQQDKLNDLVPA